MIPWLAALAVVAASTVAVIAAVAHVSRELPETRRTLGAFRGGLEPALVRVRTETHEARARIARHEAQH